MSNPAENLFIETYGYKPTILSEAPGRGNLIGEHTDYNLGFVMPFALKQTAKIALAQNDNQPMGSLRLISAFDNQLVTANIGQKAQGQWVDYIIGSIRTLADDQKIEIPALDIALDSNVPLGAGVSSSAALEVSILRALRDLLGLDISDVKIAQLAQKAENNYVGMPCGIMDQMASSICPFGDVLLIDTQNLSYEAVKIPQGYSIAVVPSGVSHALVDGAYEKLRKECEQAAKLLNVASLRKVDIKDLDKINALPDPLNKRARHIVTENQRVMDMKVALNQGDMIKAGQIITQGHASERDDYEITVAETDALVQDMVKFGALGARQIGGGFGGSCIALIETEKLTDWWQKVQQNHPKAYLI